MKKLFIAIVLMLPLFIFSQNATEEKKIVTSEDEYNYLTNGYKNSLLNGTDIKQGYQLEKIVEIKSKSTHYVFQEYKFIFKEDNSTRAILFVVYDEFEKDKSKIKYLCMPFNNVTLLLKYVQDEMDLNKSMKEFYQGNMYQILSRSLNYRYNK